MPNHFADEPSTLPLDYLRGLTHVDPTLSLDEDARILHIRDHDKSKVALISGGGSGHEPAHAGFVGTASLTAAVGGNIFASPNAAQVRRALELVKNDQGTLVVVKRYTGDVLHFGMAGESAADNVAFLVVGDDVAVPRTQGARVGRRGLAGVTLVYKVAGHTASLGAPLAEVRRLAEVVAEHTGTIGSSFAHCHVPGTKQEPAFLKEGELEVGTGIHNEPGVQKGPVRPKAQLVEEMVELVTSTADPERSFVPFTGKGDEAVVMLNNLGGMSELELVGLVPAVLAAFGKRSIKVVRLFVGTFMSSLDMPGFSITALLLPTTADRDLILAGVDAPSSAPGWRAPTVPHLSPTPTPKATATTTHAPSDLRAAGTFVAAIQAACRAVIAAEPDITRYDVIAGDGDCGLTLKRGAEGVLAAIDAGAVADADVVSSVRAIAEVAEKDMDGTSGALYSIFFSALAKALAGAPAGQATPEIYASALRAALATLLTYTSARPPSRTLVDPLVAFADALKADPAGLAAAAARAEAAAAETASLVATAGRAAYVDQAQLKKEAVPDPGAWGLAVLFKALAGAA